MPYTPPSHRSPASSASTSPDASRRGSLQSGNRPNNLPRSASYLNKHRRTPSITTFSDGSSGPLTPQGTSEDLQAMVAGASASVAGNSGTVRQSPPPVTDRRGMPSGAVISPPESASSGSDDEGITPEIRGRKSDKFKDLRDAVSQISQARVASPPPKEENNDGPPRTLQISFSTGALGGLMGSRRSSHVRSATEPSAPVIQSADNSITASDEEETDEDLRKKPQMVRKKSGELVRPALRPSSRRRPSSMPGTPVFSKAVHFDSHLEHVRHFLQVDRPLAVSAGSSPADNHDGEVEYPFPRDERSGPKSPPFEWEIITTNFPHDNPMRRSLPVKLEKVWLSADQKSMLGSIAVANIAFHKSVICRFTLDYWKTTSEVAAEYSHEILPRDSPINHDRFTFSIKLSDTANLESKTLFFCIRYTVNGNEYWDNNTNANFQVDFRKKHLPQNGKNNFQGAASKPVNGLPRSNRRQNPSSVLRPKSMPAGLDDFSHDAQLRFDQPIHEYLGETGTTGLRLKTRSSNNIASDNIGKGLTSPSGAAFANRYDFGASLSAAVQAAKDTSGSNTYAKDKDRDGLYMKSNVKTPKANLEGAPKATLPMFQPVQPTPGPETAKGLSLPSASYEELVNKYCFFGSKQPDSATRDDSLSGGRFDGSPGDNNGRRQHRRATHNSYFPNASAGASPEDSPPQGYLATSNVGQSSVSTPGAFATFGGTLPDSTAFDAQPRMVPDRFPWGGDAHAATAIRG